MKAFACSAVLLLAAPFVMAQDKMATDKAAKAPAASAQPMAAMGETVKVSAKVTAIDKAARLVALQTADGGETIIKVGPDARNFDQIKIGDVVNAEYQYAAVVIAEKGVERARHDRSDQLVARKSRRKARRHDPEGRLDHCERRRSRC